MVARSSDDGETLAATLSATGGQSLSSGDAHFAVDPQGRFWVAFSSCDPSLNPGQWDGWQCALRLTHSDSDLTQFSPSRRVSETVTFVDPRYKTRQDIRKPVLVIDPESGILHGIWRDSRFRITPSQGVFTESLFYFNFDTARAR